ncbi:uncharacterized protein V1516DRAFT_669755 [Lipomyces oligophaga]|uniref:uncharacterized protein n=1 Tax=Lipomyces oligophaga TaxID=45792 RepID=UPI0034CF0A1E
MSEANSELEPATAAELISENSQPSKFGDMEQTDSVKATQAEETVKLANSAEFGEPVKPTVGDQQPDDKLPQNQEGQEVSSVTESSLVEQNILIPSIESILGLTVPSTTGNATPAAPTLPGLNATATNSTEFNSNQKHPFFFTDDDAAAATNSNIGSESDGEEDEGEEEEESDDGYDPEEDAKLPIGQSTSNISEAQNDKLSDSHVDLKAPFTVEETSQYDAFLKDEAETVQRGDWERFPVGARLFIGNLPSEAVQKKTLFRVFNKYGKLAQISIKQAYGFVQFYSAEDCSQAIAVEQGVLVEGRRLHLEVSKPQARKERNAPREKSYGRRSPSPRGKSRIGGNGGSSSGSYGSYLSQDGPDYGSRRGDRRDKSPRRGREREYRERSPPRRNRSPSPVLEWPLPRRRPEDVPDCQILVADKLDRNFVWYVRKAFEDRFVKVDVLDVSPNLSMSATVRQMIVEGISGVVVLNLNLQEHSKVSMQVFERTSGSNSVRYDEYVDIEPSVAAEIIVRAKQKNLTQSASVNAAANPALAQYLLASLAQQRN